MAITNASISFRRLANSSLTKIIVVALICGFLFPDFAFAQLDEVAGRLEKIRDALSTLSAVTVTIAVLYVGYKVLFGGSTIKEMMPTIIGAIIIACAAQIASLFLDK
jgi:type IV secretion system protein VirB2